MTFFSFLAGILGAAGAAGAYFKWFAAPFSFYLCFGALIVIALNLPISLVRFVRRGWRGVSFIALIFGILATGTLGLLLKAAVEHPLTDVTNQPNTPPEFRHSAFSIPAPGMEDFLDVNFRLERAYDMANAEKQKRIYPGLYEVYVKATPEQAFQFVRGVLVKDFPAWRIVRQDGESKSIELEIVDPTFNTIEDFVVQAVPAEEGAMLLLRSRSRFGFTDFGSNEKRIYGFSEEIARTGRAMVPPVEVELRQ